MFQKTKNKNKKWFSRNFLQSFSSTNVLTKHKGDWLKINGKQSVKLEKETIEFEDYFKQIRVAFNIYADFECKLKGVKSYEGFYTQKIKITFLVVLLTKLFVFMIGFLSHLWFSEVKMLIMNLLKQFLMNISTVKK